MSKSPQTVSPSKSLVAELASSGDLGDPLSDEDDLAAYSQAEETLSEVPGVVHTWSADAEMIIKSEPVDDVEGLTFESQPPLPLQLVEHSYSHTDHIGVCSDDRYKNIQATEDESTSRTSGHKWAGEEQLSRYSGDGSDRQGIDVMIRMRKKCAPLITSRLIIPVVRVARSALTEKNMMENVSNEMLDKQVDPSGEIISEHHQY